MKVEAIRQYADRTAEEKPSTTTEEEAYAESRTPAQEALNMTWECVKCGKKFKDRHNVGIIKGHDFKGGLYEPIIVCIKCYNKGGV